VLAFASATTPAVNAAVDRDDDRSDQSRVYDAQSANVPLQPFTLDPPIETKRAIRVAYYAPPPVPHAEPSYRQQEDDDSWQPRSSAAHPTVSGNHAVLRGGIAYAPANAPYQVKEAIWAINTIRHKPYHWGGGHGSFYDSGYDCSGAVSFALHSAGALYQPLPSSDFLRYGERGRGRWITIYSRRGHTFAVIAGLRLDTTDFRYGGDVGPRWYTEARSPWGFSVRHPSGL
jgi:cell wall-associated NlpC family hydrolase